jgi:hypothetical protein
MHTCILLVFGFLVFVNILILLIKNIIHGDGKNTFEK